MPMAALQMTATRTDYLAETSGGLGKTIAEINLRARTGAAVITIVRNGKPHHNPERLPPTAVDVS